LVQLLLVDEINLLLGDLLLYYLLLLHLDYLLCRVLRSSGSAYHANQSNRTKAHH
jgi:hypothetical protein